MSTNSWSHTDGQNEFPESKVARIRRAIIGAPRSVKDPSIFHRISLIAFMAWVGLGADGLSSSAYGPEEAFRAVGDHAYLAIALAVATALTVFIISYAYSRIIERFPFGGGGYVVASKLLGRQFGVVSGSALLVDYVLTISVSIAAGADQVFSVLPEALHPYRMGAIVVVIVILMLLNLRGVKESVMVLMPIFLSFLVTHLILLIGGLAVHAADAPRVAENVQRSFTDGMATLGLAGMGALFLRAYSMGAGTYTGIEAVSNGLQIMREPKVETAKRTMFYMAISLAATAAGILLLYLLFSVTPEHGKTMNAVLFERFAGEWKLAGLPVGYWFVVFALGSEAALLFVAAQAGFIDGPRVMSNMAADSWLPHRFSSLSDRLTMQNGVVLISTAAIMVLVFTGGSPSTLILMYSINVFLTFSLSETGMVRYWFVNRKKFKDWYRHIVIHIIGLILCLFILAVSVFEKFGEGGWVTLVVTLGLIGLCVLIRRHYRHVTSLLKRLDEVLIDLPVADDVQPGFPQPNANTAVLLVNGYNGLGIHSFLSIERLFPGHFRNFVFVSVHVVDAGGLKGAEDLERAALLTEEDLKKYVSFAKQHGFYAEYRTAVGTDVLDETEKLCIDISTKYRRSIFFAGKLVFQREKWYQRFLHNETANAFQRRLQFFGLNSMVLPVRVFAQT